MQFFQTAGIVLLVGREINLMGYDQHLKKLSRTENQSALQI